jgi:hypothetical protein
MVTLLKPYKFLFNNGKNKKRRKSYCTTKLPTTRLTRVIEKTTKLPTTRLTRVIKKTTKLRHIVENRLLARQLPLSQEETTSLGPIGSSFPMHQINGVASSSLSPQVVAQATITAKTLLQE